MRKLVQALLITLGCFSAAGVYANEGETKEVVTTTETETGSSEEKTELRLFQQGGEETTAGEEPGNDEPKA